MCGICGIYHLDRNQPVEEHMLVRMARCMNHRGPDDEGYHLQGNVGLGHQRLSIIDLSPSGRQPMANEDGSLWLVCNGEIYNHIELRDQLISRGHRFRSKTDVEVILHLYEENGPQCVTHLNGMFAFTIWDTRKQVLFAARDHFGIKPFYYTFNGKSFAFASEIKALFRTPLLEPRIDARGLVDYITFQFCLGTKTLFHNVKRLQPGHMLTIEACGKPTVRKYWDIDFTIDTDHTEKYFEDQLRELIQDAVRIQLRADVPVGSHLSGGLDSSTVTCLASLFLGSPIKTFSGGFRDAPHFDETPYARLVSETVGTEHHEIFPTAQDFVEVMPVLMYQMDEPAAGPGLFPQYFVSKLATQHVKVVLGGQGGDEIFGGYTRYLIAYLEQCLKGGIAGTHEDHKYIVTFESILPNLRQLQGYEPLLRHFWEEGLFDSEDRRYFRLIDRSPEIRKLINLEHFIDERDYNPYDEFRNVFYSADCKALINKITWFDMKTLLPALLQVEDRTSMAVSLESRVPLLDRRIVELVASMPPMIKYKGGRSKHIFRKVVADFIPPEINSRTDKMGFPVPLSEWYRNEPVREFIMETLLGDRARLHGLIRTDCVESFLESAQPYGRGIWGLLCFELWMKAFFDGSHG
jgi:asparagine synthase (glutamine-hydrolysing)